MHSRSANAQQTKLTLFSHIYCVAWHNQDERLRARAPGPRRQSWTVSWNQPIAGEDGTSPSTWMMTTTSAIANGRSRGGTDHSTSALDGACRAGTHVGRRRACAEGTRAPRPRNAMPGPASQGRFPCAGNQAELHYGPRGTARAPEGDSMRA